MSGGENSEFNVDLHLIVKGIIANEERKGLVHHAFAKAMLDFLEGDKLDVWNDNGVHSPTGGSKVVSEEELQNSCLNEHQFHIQDKQPLLSKY